MKTVIELHKSPNMLKQMIVLQENAEYFATHRILIRTQNLCVHAFIHAHN